MIIFEFEDGKRRERDIHGSIKGLKHDHRRPVKVILPLSMKTLGKERLVEVFRNVRLALIPDGGNWFVEGVEGAVSMQTAMYLLTGDFHEQVKMFNKFGLGEGDVL